MRGRDEAFILPYFAEKCLEKHLNVRIYTYMGSSGGIVTGYGLDGPRIESRWRRDFPHLSRTALGPTPPPPVQWVPGLSRG